MTEPESPAGAPVEMEPQPAVGADASSAAEAAASSAGGATDQEGASTARELLSMLPSWAGLRGPVIALGGLAAVCVALLVSGYTFGVALDVVLTGLGGFATILLISLIVAYLLDPVIDRFEARGWDRTVAIVVSLSLALTLSSLTALLLVPYVVTEVNELSESMDGYLESLLERGVELQKFLDDKIGYELPLGFESLSKELPKLLDKLPSDALDPVKAIGQSLVGSTFGLLGSLAPWSLFPIFVFFLLRDFDAMKMSLFEMVPFRFRGEVVDYYGQIDTKMSQFVRGQLIVAAMMAVLYATGLGLLTNIHLAVLVGVVAGILFVIPYFGTFVGIVAGSLLAIIEFGVGWELVKVWAVFGGVQLIEGSLLTPKIVGDSVGLHPMAVMLALIIGGNLFGFLGILLAIPIAAALSVLVGAALGKWRKTDWFTEGEAEAPPPESVT